MMVLNTEKEINLASLIVKNEVELTRFMLKSLGIISEITWIKLWSIC